MQHQPVLYKEIIHAIRPRPGGRYVDGTVGAGGHAAGILEASTADSGERARGILQASSPDGLLLGFDRDPDALALAAARLKAFGERATLRHASYVDLDVEMQRMAWTEVDGILLDLGVSSMQLDRPERGFSFKEDAPLDMRFDPTRGETAADLLNSLPEEDLADLIYRYGEERRSRAVARAIVRSRPVLTTRQLAGIVASAAGGGKIHPATRTFQALRIATNRELESLEAVLPKALRALAPGGRFAVISFHSLEDRIVKRFFRQESQDCLCPPGQPVCTCGHKAQVDEVFRKAVVPDADEIRSNPRARSARLRIVEKRELK